jgi:hypothetical protein
MRMLALAVAAGAALSAASAATIVKQEPGTGQFRPGTRVLVDDGSCPAGKIKEVVDTAYGQVPAGQKVAGLRRIRHCIKR